MVNITEHREWVNAEAQFQDRRADLLESQKNPNSSKHRHLAINLRRILSDLESACGELESKQNSAPTSISGCPSSLLASLPDSDAARAIIANPLAITPDHLKGLPQELIDQVNISETDRFEANVVRLVSATSGGTMLLDNIMIGLYLMTKETHQRQQLANKLYRMTRKSLLFSVPGKKGYYTVVKPESEQPEDAVDDEDTKS